MEVSHSQFSVNVLLKGAPQDRQIKLKEETGARGTKGGELAGFSAALISAVSLQLSSQERLKQHLPYSSSQALPCC